MQKVIVVRLHLQGSNNQSLLARRLFKSQLVVQMDVVATTEKVPLKEKVVSSRGWAGVGKG